MKNRDRVTLYKLAKSERVLDNVINCVKAGKSISPKLHHDILDARIALRDVMTDIKSAAIKKVK